MKGKGKKTLKKNFASYRWEDLPGRDEKTDNDWRS
jgi:hypothetical protein